MPEDQRRTYVLVDVRAGEWDEEGNATAIRGNYLMPEGVPCKFDAWQTRAGVRFAHLIEPVIAEFPIGEIRTTDGSVLQLE